jgi:hypothetical protein
MSETVAEAAETASVALIVEPFAEAFEVSFDSPLGNRIRTTPSQNAIRTKNIMVLPFEFPLSPYPLGSPLLFIPRATVTGTLENGVRLKGTFSRVIEAKAIRFFRKVEVF